MPIHHFLKGIARPISPSSHACEADGWIFLTGQLGREIEKPGAPFREGIVAQTEQTLINIKRLLGELGVGLADLVSVRVFLTHFDRDYSAMNEAYAKFFPEDARPARTCVGVTGIVSGALIEIDGIVRRP